MKVGSKAQGREGDLHNNPTCFGLALALAASNTACGSSTDVMKPQNSSGGTAGSGYVFDSSGGVSQLPVGGASSQNLGLAGTYSGSVTSPTLPSESCDNSGTGGNANSAADASTLPAIEQARSELAWNTSPQISMPDFQSVVGAVNQFGLDVFHSVVASEVGNVVMSPTSTVYALGMAYLGANANTQTQMALVLHDSFSPGVYHEGLNLLALALSTRNVAPHQSDYGCMFSVLSLNNDIWVQRGFPLVPAYLDALSVNYGAGVQLLDFAADPNGSQAVINQWVANRTGQRILDLLPSGSVTNRTRIVLSDTLYFKGWWAQPFPIANTFNQSFFRLDGTTVTVPMMHEARTAAFGGDASYGMVDLPYDGNELSMALVLPAAGQFNTIRDGLTQEWLAQALSQTAAQQGELTIPKFAFTWGANNLATSLQALGMTDAFNKDTADFSNMETPQPLYIDGVYHKAFIGVDESSTVATAATAITIPQPMICCFGGPPVLVFDRPFLFFIHDATGAILFAGQVLDPTAT